MGKSDATAERRRREGRTDNCARRERAGERERDGHKRDKAMKSQSLDPFHRCGSSGITVSHFAAPPSPSLLLSPVPPVRFPYESTGRIRFRYESTRRLRGTETATSSQLITPSPYILYCRISSPSHTAVITRSATAFLDYNNIINISAPVTRIHLSLHHETDRFVLSSRRAGIDYKTLCCINSPRQQGR